MWPRVILNEIEKFSLCVCNKMPLRYFTDLANAPKRSIQIFSFYFYFCRFTDWTHF